MLSTDPVALSYLLRGTGPVELGAGQTLTAENAVAMLLSDVYAQIPDPALQNVYFNAVASQVFAAVSAGRAIPQTVLQGLTQSATERRILLWSADEDEQALIAPTHLSGALTRSEDGAPQGGHLPQRRHRRQDGLLPRLRGLRAAGPLPG